MLHQISDLRASWKMILLLACIQPMMFLAIGSLAGRDALTSHHRVALASAVLLMTSWNSTVWSGGAILRRERADGTLSASLRSVPDLRLVLLVRSLTSSVVTLLPTVVVVGVWLINVPGPAPFDRPDVLPVSILLTVLTGTSFGLLVSAAFLLTPHGPQLSAVLVYPVFLVGGLMVPVDALPAALRVFSNVISLRWVQQLTTAAATGSVDTGAIAVALGLLAAYFVGGWQLLCAVERRSRMSGSFDLA